MSEQANIDFVKLWYDAYMKADAPRLLSYMAPDVDWIIPDMPGLVFSGRRRGRTEVEEFFRMVSERQQLRRFAPEEFFASGDRVVVLGTYAWTVRSNGAEFGGYWAHIFDIKDGKVASFRQLLDTNLVVEAHRRPADVVLGPAWAGNTLQATFQAPVA